MNLHRTKKSAVRAAWIASLELTPYFRVRTYSVLRRGWTCGIFYRRRDAETLANLLTGALHEFRRTAAGEDRQIPGNADLPPRDWLAIEAEIAAIETLHGAARPGECGTVTPLGVECIETEALLTETQIVAIEALLGQPVERIG